MDFKKNRGTAIFCVFFGLAGIVISQCLKHWGDTGNWMPLVQISLITTVLCCAFGWHLKNKNKDQS